MKTTEELRKLSPQALQDEMTSLQEKLCKVEFELRTGQTKSGHLRPLYRKQIARIHTIKTEMENAQEAKPAEEKSEAETTK